MKLNLNLATAPLENNRRFIAGAGLAGFVALIALIILAHQSYTTWRANSAIRADISRIEKEIQIEAERQGDLARYFELPEAKTVLDRSNFLNSLIAARTFPWPKIFEDLEKTSATRRARDQYCAATGRWPRGDQNHRRRDG